MNQQEDIFTKYWEDEEIPLWMQRAASVLNFCTACEVFYYSYLLLHRFPFLNPIPDLQKILFSI